MSIAGVTVPVSLWETSNTVGCYGYLTGPFHGPDTVMEGDASQTDVAMVTVRPGTVTKAESQASPYSDRNRK